MKVDIEEVSATRRRIAVEIPADRVSTAFEEAFRSVSQRARIKGFRPGRIPRPVLERYFGDEVRSQVATQLVQEGFSRAIEGKDLHILSQPDLEIGSVKENEPLAFSATVDVRPPVGVIETSGLSAVRPAVAVSDEQVAEVLERIRLQHAELVPISDRTELSRGDFASVSIGAACDGEDIPALAVESANVEVAGGHLPAEVDQRLALARVGETFTVDGPPPEGSPPELAGKSIQYTVTVRSIAERRLPTLDDEFAKDHGDCETLDDLRQRIRDRLQHEAERRADAAVRDAVIDQLLERHPIEPPVSLVERRVENLLEELKIELLGRGLRLSSAEHESEAREKLTPRAEREVRTGILLDAAAGQLSVEVSDDELAAHIGRLVSGAGKHADRLRHHYEHAHARDAVRSDLRRARALSRIVESVALGIGEPAASD